MFLGGVSDTGGGHGKEKPVGEGKKELALALAFCSSVGGRALANIWLGCCSVAFSPYNNGTARTDMGLKPLQTSVGCSIGLH